MVAGQQSSCWACTICLTDLFSFRLLVYTHFCSILSTPVLSTPVSSTTVCFFFTQYQDDSQAVQYYPNTNLFRCNSTITFKLKDVGNLGCDLPAMGLISSLSVVVCEGTINFVVFPIANRIEPIEPGVPLCHGGYLSSSSLNW